MDGEGHYFATAMLKIYEECDITKATGKGMLVKCPPILHILTLHRQDSAQISVRNLRGQDDFTERPLPQHSRWCLEELLSSPWSEL
jgi:hypothetical protein